MAAKKELFKGLTEILEQLSKKGVKAKTPSVRGSRRSLKGARKFEPIAGAGSRQPGRKIGEGVPTAGKGRATVKKTTPPIKAQRVDVKAKPKTSRTVGRKKIPMKTFTPIAGAGSRKAGPTRNAFVSKPTTKPTTTGSKVTPPKTPASKAAINKRIAALLGAAGAVGLTGAMLNKKDKAQAAPKSMPLPKSKPTPPSKPKVTPKAMPKSSGPSTRGSAKKGATKRISAGPNTGFGPKGNIFPGSSAERAALMKMYGGTGSAAAKAAAAGKQGNMEAGRKELNAAKKKRLSKPVERKSGGSVVARQVKGFGAARRPKK
jgi:hypothetical protein